MTPSFWSTLLLVATCATVATAHKEFVFDVILLEYLAAGCYRCYSSQGVYLWRQFLCRVLCYWLLQVLRVQQVATSLAESSLPLIVTGLNHIKICLPSWFHIMAKLLLRSYFQHIVIWYCQKRDLDFYFKQSNHNTTKDGNIDLWSAWKNFTFMAWKIQVK